MITIGGNDALLAGLEVGSHLSLFASRIQVIKGRSAEILGMIATTAVIEENRHTQTSERFAA